VVTGVTFTNPGSGYTSAPSVSFSTSGVGGNSIWERYNANTKAWETVAFGTAPSNANVTILAGHTVALNTLAGINSLTIQNGGVLQTDGQSRNLRVKGDINNYGVFGGTNPAVNKLSLELDGRDGVYNIGGEGVYNFVTLRTLTGIQALVVNINANLTLSGNLQGLYGSTSATDYGDDNVTINIGNGYTVKANVLHSSSTTNTAASYGNYTYNVNGVLDLSGSTTVSGLIPHATASASTITLNVNGVLKIGTQFRTVSTAPGASEGKVVLTIGDGGLVDATKANNTFAVTPNYFVVAGNGALKRNVGTTAVEFPIGTSVGSYSPVVLTNSGTVDNFTVSVQNSFDHPVADATKVVNKQWNIQEEVAGGSDVTARFGWQAADQASSFDPAQLVAVMKFAAVSWNNTAASLGGNGTTTDPYTATVAGITSFSSFGITNYTKATATIKLEGGIYIYDGQSHAAAGFAYGTGGEADKLSPEVNITYKDANDQVLAGAPVQAGTYTVTASFEGNSYYLPATATASISIGQRPLTITATNQTIECGSVMELGKTAFTSEGLVAGDVVNQVTLSSTGGGVGTYPIVPGNATGTGLSNYSITYVNGSLVVQDITKPQITYTPTLPLQCYNNSGSYTVPQLTAKDACSAVNISYSISGATTRSGSGADASGSFNVGTSTIHWVVADGQGNQSTAQTIVVVNAVLTVSIPDVYAMNPAVDEKNTLYIGYGPTSLNVSAVAGGGTSPYTYQWNGGQTTQGIAVGAAGSYTVTIKDANQCQASASIVMQTLDVSCGKDNSKVKLCHNGKEICVASVDVQEHLDHGDYLGSCKAVAAVDASDSLGEESTAYQVKIYPNPVWEQININVSRLQTGAILQVYNASGAIVLSQRLTSSAYSISAKGLTAGIYYVVVRNGDQVTTHKIVKQ
jgi:hypothetical protein